MTGIIFINEMEAVMARSKKYTIVISYSDAYTNAKYGVDFLALYSRTDICNHSIFWRLSRCGIIATHDEDTIDSEEGATDWDI